MEARAAHRSIAVLMYAQRGTRQAIVLLFGLHLRRLARSEDGAAELVPVGKSYFGFTDEELRQLDRCVRNHTIDRFGPVRAGRAEARVRGRVQFGPAVERHKSGVAMRFPRIHRIRWDKPAEEADRLETLIGMIVE